MVRNRLQKRPSARTFSPVRYFLCFAACTVLSLVPAGAEWTVVMLDGRRHVPIEDVATFYKLSQPVSNGSDFTLTGDGTIKGRAGAKEVFINGVKYVLCFPIGSKDGRILVSAMDVTKIIEPVFRPGKIKNATAVRTVILDAGHGGHDSGARGPMGCEKDATLDVVVRAKKLLQENGYNVRLTRSTDVFIPLEDRPQLANKYSNAIFVSVHFNKSKSAGATGLETYCLAPRGVPSMDEENLSYSDFKAHPGHSQDAENTALATAVHSSLVRSLRLPDRGVKRARFVVIRDIKIPGILIEGGFMDGDSNSVASVNYRQSIAKSILEGVNRYKQAVGGEMHYQQPSAVIAATDPTTIPSLSKPMVPVGSKTSIDRAITKAAESLEPTVVISGKSN